VSSTDIVYNLCFGDKQHQLLWFFNVSANIAVAMFRTNVCEGGGLGSPYN
jgi:hypothetical protein